MTTEILPETFMIQTIAKCQLEKEPAALNREAIGKNGTSDVFHLLC